MPPITTIALISRHRLILYSFDATRKARFSTYASRCIEVVIGGIIGGVDFARVSLSVATDDLPRLNVLLLPYLYRDADYLPLVEEIQAE